MQIEVRHLTKTFGALRANDDISLRFAAGQIHGVLGENGAGKSTLMKMLSGFLQRDGGEVLLDDRPARLDGPADALRAGIGMVHQDPLDVPAFSAIENFFCASPRAAMPDIAVARRALQELDKRLGFAIPPNATVARLTVGQRQQLEIMRLLACGARVLILDEPTTGITASQARALFAALRQIASDGNTVLFVSHKLEEVAALCNTVCVLRAGRVVGAGQMAMPQPQNQLLTMMFGEQEPETRRQGEAETRRQGDTKPDETLSPSPPLPVSASRPAVWQLDDVSIRAGALGLQHLTLELRGGEIVGLAGLEGSGQQLLLGLLSGRLRPSAGRRLLNGADATTAPFAFFRRAAVEYLPADRMVDGVIGPLSLTDHMALLQPRSDLLVNRPAAADAARAAIADYDIRATQNTPIIALSGGNQQRAMLALLPPHCAGLLLDQPTRGLDVASARAVWQRLLQRRADGSAIVFASADLDELLEYSDHILVFFGGQVSPLLPHASLSYDKLAELIGGVGFGAINDEGR